LYGVARRDLDARVVDENIDRAELALRRLDEPSQVVHRADIGRDSDRAHAQRLARPARLFELLGVTRRQHEIDAARRERARDVCPEPARCAGQDGIRTL